MISQESIDKGCNICSGKFKRVVYDGRTKQGPWAFMCEGCWKMQGTTLGIGCGQAYDVKTRKNITKEVQRNAMY